MNCNRHRDRRAGRRTNAVNPRHRPSAITASCEYRAEHEQRASPFAVGVEVHIVGRLVADHDVIAPLELRRERVVGRHFARVAQVDDGAFVGPLPDLDLHVQAGARVVGRRVGAQLTRRFGDGGLVALALDAGLGGPSLDVAGGPQKEHPDERGHAEHDDDDEQCPLSTGRNSQSFVVMRMAMTVAVAARHSARDQRGERPYRRQQSDQRERHRPRHWSARQVTFLGRRGRWSDQRHRAAYGHRTTEGQHQIGQQIVAE